MKVMLCTNINQEMSSVLKPKCIPVDNTNDALQMSQCLGHSAEGFLLPCCWIDSGWNLRDEVQDIFYQAKFKISNVQNIKEITQSIGLPQFLSEFIENKNEMTVQNY